MLYILYGTRYYTIRYEYGEPARPKRADIIIINKKIEKVGKTKKILPMLMLLS